jgi:hypothetical protein
MNRARPYIAAGLDHQGRVPQAHRALPLSATWPTRESANPVVPYAFGGCSCALGKAACDCHLYPPVRAAAGPGDLEAAESYCQRDPVRRPPPVPWRVLGAGCAVLLMVPLLAHLVLRALPYVAQVAAR